MSVRLYQSPLTLTSLALLLRHAKIPQALPYSKDLVKTLITFPVALECRLGERVGLDGDEYIQVLYCVSVENLQALADTILEGITVPFILFILALHHPQTSSEPVPLSIQKEVSENYATISTWEELLAEENLSAGPGFKQVEERIMTDLKAELNPVMHVSSFYTMVRRDTENMQDFSSMLLHLKPEIEAPPLPPDYERMLRPIAQPTLELMPSPLPIPAPVAPMEGVVDIRIEDDKILNELELNKLVDPLSLFLRIACGTAGMELLKAFTKMPLNTRYIATSSEARLEYIHSLSPTVFAAYVDTDSWVQGKSRGTVILDNIIPNQTQALFVCCAKLCGELIRKAIANSPLRGVQTAYTITEHKQALNALLTELTALLHGHRDYNRNREGNPVHYFDYSHKYARVEY